MAVIGAGVMGACVALVLAERGVHTVVFDREAAPLSGASRWNEGKIHLGSLYSASGNLATARRILPGGLRFFKLMERLVDAPLEGHITNGTDLYLVHRKSVAPPESIIAYNRAVGALVEDHPDRDLYPGQPRAGDFREVALSSLGIEVGPDILAAVECPERSVATEPVADLLAQRLEDNPLVELRMSTQVSAVRETSRGMSIEAGSGNEDVFSHVVNAAWEGRPAIDQASFGETDSRPNHRRRAALFFEAVDGIGLRSAVIAVGPFGDFKIYGDGRAYLSWYPAGLLGEGESVAPPTISEPDSETKAAIAKAQLEGLSRLIPGLEQLRPQLDFARIECGWVYSQGRGNLADPTASLHGRANFGVTRRGSYISVDTGKYSTAPDLAHDVADMICPA